VEAIPIEGETNIKRMHDQRAEAAAEAARPPVPFGELATADVFAALGELTAAVELEAATGAPAPAVGAVQGTYDQKPDLNR
jgi:hypothetical protein